ncbi:MAG TPA: head GIN domain-containing protein [Allosphingosinicella sp.]|nr:head GIN domain-containing protein [Allosphingosinicella sp.]
MRIAFLLVSFALAGACNASTPDGGGAAGGTNGGGGERTEASGPRSSRDFQVGAFERINLAGPMDVQVRVGAQPSVRAEGREGLDRLEIVVVDGELRIGTVRGTSGPLRDIVVHVTVPALTAASLNGPGDIDIDRVRGARFAAAVNGPGNLSFGELRVETASFAVNGPGGIRAAGGAPRAEAVLSGPGNMRLDGFETRDASVSLTGPGHIDLRATGAVSVTLSGPGNVTVTGGARCSVTSSGPGSVRCPAGG